MKNSALIVVDYSNDLLLTMGNLHGKPDQVESYIVRRIDDCNSHKCPIFMMDLHHETIITIQKTNSSPT